MQPLTAGACWLPRDGSESDPGLRDVLRPDGSLVDPAEGEGSRGFGR